MVLYAIELLELLVSDYLPQPFCQLIKIHMRIFTQNLQVLVPEFTQFVLICVPLSTRVSVSTFYTTDLLLVGVSDWVT
jgi:hypothetical protein